MQKIRVTIWNEFVHERQNAHVTQIYPKGIHDVLAKALSVHPELEVRTSTLGETDHGLSQSLLDQTDVLTYWGHAAHDDVPDDAVLRIQKRVLEGMGFVPLHSAHWSKIFKRL